MKLTERFKRVGPLFIAVVAVLCMGALLPAQAQIVSGDQKPAPHVSCLPPQVIYVSSSDGKDTNDGLSPATAKATLAAAATLVRAGSSDWMLLERGDEWAEGFAGLLPDGASDDAPIVIAAYGTGADPRVMPGEAWNARPDGDATRWFGVEFAELPAAQTPTLIPGHGWTGPTEQPAAVGDPSQPGYDAKAIARWDVVPYQTFDGIFEIGVVAFHMNGIERVDFSVDGGPWTSVYEMTLNPRTGVVEYWAQLDASEFQQDGPVEVRAIAWPAAAGQPRLLAGALGGQSADNGMHSIWLRRMLNAPTIERFVSAQNGDDLNGDGSAARPLATLQTALTSIAAANGDAGGATIYLAEGTYQYGAERVNRATDSSEAWLTITPAVGVARDVVRITHHGSRDGLRTNRVHLKGLTIESQDIVLLSNGPLDDYLWVENCVLIGPGSLVDARWHQGFTATWLTGSTVSYNRDGFRALLVRDTRVERIGSDSFTGSGLVVNSESAYVDRGDTSFHPDVFQFLNNQHNRIAYGVTAVNNVRSQGFFSSTNNAQDLAFVNCTIDNSGWPHTFSFKGAHHIVVIDSDFLSRSDFNEPERTRNVLLSGSFFRHNTLDNLPTDAGMVENLIVRD